MRTAHRTWSICFILLLASGCGGELEGSVQGTVLLDNAPLNRGTVTFHPAGSGAAAYGRIQPDGSYAITTGKRSGLLPGDYVVTVVATAAPSYLKKEIAGRLLTPLRYQSVDKSPLHFTIERGRHQIDLPLTSK